jgi:hypothetical protein
MRISLIMHISINRESSLNYTGRRGETQKYNISNRTFESIKITLYEFTLLIAGEEDSKVLSQKFKSDEYIWK